MPVTIQTLANGDTNYIGKHNTNYQNIKVILDSLESQVGSILLQSGEGLALKTALFGDTLALIGSESYIPVDSGTTVDVSAGHVWLPSNQRVVENPSTASIDMTGKSSGTYYVHAGEDGSPSVDTESADALWSFEWDGSTSITSITRVAITTWGNVDWQAAKVSDELGSFDTLDERLEAIEGLLLPPPYDMAGTFSGVPSANEVIVRYPLPRNVKFPVGLTDSQGVAGAAATGSTTFDIRKDGVSVGSMNFAVGATVATFSMASETSFSAGNVLTVVGPDPADSTLGDIGICLVGERV